MDETKKTQGLPSDNAEKAPEGSEGTTPKADAKTYTEDEFQGALQADRIKRGRDDKSLSGREVAVKSREDANKAEQERRDAAELAEAQKDPDRLAVYQSKKAERQRARSQDERDAAQDKREAEHEAEINAAREAQKEINIWQIASAKGIDPVRLKNLSEKFNIEGKEKLEELAGEIASGKPEPTDKKKPHDSLVTSGGGKDLSGLSPNELAQKAYNE
ncbi:hypothetical protein ES707_01298 [subsurface metagenome]